MSSSDPSDLVDSDEGDSAPSPRSMSQRRLQLVTPSSSATSAGASSTPKRRPGGDGGAGAKKRSRLEPSGDGIPTGLGPRMAKGKAKAVSCSDASAAVPKSRRSPRKDPHVDDSSSSWQSSGTSGSSSGGGSGSSSGDHHRRKGRGGRAAAGRKRTRKACNTAGSKGRAGNTSPAVSAAKKGIRRGRRRPNTTVGTRKSGIDSDSSYVCDDDDDGDCLRNTDSDDAGRVETAGGGEDSGSESDGPVLCRCGARDWQDGARWIRCDARGCRTWEHVGCAYPEAEQDERGGEKKLPQGGHMCDSCRAKGGTSPATAAKQARKGGRRSLTRCGDDGPMTSRSETPLEASPSADGGASPDALGASSLGGSARDRTDADAGTGNSRVRRSQRVSRREGTRLLLRKNVVGAAGVLSSSSEDETSLLRAGMGGFDGGGGGRGDDSCEAGSDEGSDGFWAPEGRVEMTQEYRCRCGGTLERSCARSGGRSGGGGGAADGVTSGQWVQCHSDACGVWEHAACCVHGCGSSPNSSALPAETTATTVPGHRASRHWCLPCDPKGKKHARWKEKRRRKLKQQRPAETTITPDGPVASRAVRGARGQKTKRNEADEMFGVLLDNLWRAVFRGNARLLEETFRELDNGGGGLGASAGQVLEAGHLPSSGCLDFGSCFSSGGGTDDFVKGEIVGGDGADLDAPAVCDPLPAGLSLLMLAAGYWKSIVEEATITAVAYPDPASPPAGSVGIISATKSSSSVKVKEEPGKTSEAALEAAPSLAHVPTPPLAPERAPAAPKDETTNTASSLIDPGLIPKQPPVAAEPSASVAATPDAEVKTEMGKEPGTKVTTEAAPATQVAASTTSGVALPQLGSESRLQVLRMILDRGGERAVLAVDGEGRTALHHAGAMDGAGEAAVLLEAGALGKEAALAMNHERLTPLHVAAAAGSTATCISILRALAPGPRARVLAAGCGPLSTRESDVEEPPDESVLHLACLEGHAACVEAILDEEGRMEKELAEEMTSHVLTGVPVDTPPTHRPLALVRTAEGATALMAAAGCPSPPCVDLILGHLRERAIPPPGSKLTELRAVDQAGMNALHYAAGRDEEGSVGAAKALLDAEKYFARSDSAASVVWRGWDDEAMINGGDANNDASPLHLAAAISHKDMVSLLLGEGANSVMPDRQGWTPVMYADFAGRKEGAVLELLQHEPEKQLEALGRVLSCGGGGGGGIGGGRSDPHERHRHQHHSRIVEVVRNLVTVPSFFSLVNGFIRRRPDLLLGSLSFLRNEPGLLDFENKRSLMRALLARPDEDTQNALDVFAHYPMAGFGYDYNSRIITSRGGGRALGALLSWMESAVCRWGEEGLGAWLRTNRPSFEFLGEAGYGQGVDREAWEMIAGDLVLPFPPTSPPGEPPPPPQQEERPQEVEVVDGGHIETQREAFFVPVEEGMSSYCPRGLSGDRGDATAGGGVGGGSATRGQQKREKDLQAFELLGIVIGAHMSWDKVLNLNLNPVVWKTILSRKVRLSDLELVDPTYHKSLVQVLEMDGVDQLGLSFECLELQFCAEGRDVDPDDAITDDNKAFYASLAVESRTSGRWRKQAKALAHGLRRMVPLGLLKMFTENELGLLLAGPGDIDPHDWERNADFRGEASTVLQMWFWSVVRSLTKEERSLLLQFATGCSRLPAGGFRGLAPRVFTVVVVEYLPERPLPMAATCFYMLKLPRYPDLYSLRKYLLVAIRHGAAGFEFS